MPGFCPLENRIDIGVGFFYSDGMCMINRLCTDRVCVSGFFNQLNGLLLMVNYKKLLNKLIR